VENPHSENAGSQVVQITERPGTIIGSYKLLEKLGEGGFAVVWAAEQKESVKRVIALKILKVGMDTKQIIARFEGERQALALMDHPNIATVFDAGATAEGRPFFVMELVRGVSITEFCDRERLNIRTRIELFTDVCRAIRHAHQKGIIHRDIKPGNILVTTRDDKIVPKVIDFGIAKSTQIELTERTVYTELGEFLGTPVYMSPEQADMAGVDIDTRSDIYSLGVLLYELLVGTPPFEDRELKAGGLDGLLRIIREQDPPRPSIRFSQLDHKARMAIARNRNEFPSRLERLVRGDLEQIVLKAMEKRRNNRYETVNQLGADVEGLLLRESDFATPAIAVNRSARAWKSAWRQKRAVLLSGIATALVIVAMVWRSYLLILLEASAQEMTFERLTQEWKAIASKVAIGLVACAFVAVFGWVVWAASNNKFWTEKMD